MSDFLLVLIAMNLMAAAAVVVVLALRLPMRRLFGAGVAYGLWAIVPMTALAVLWPSRVVRVAAPTAAETLPAEPSVAAAGPASVDLDLLPLAVAVWFVGAVASICTLLWRQAQFARAAREGRAGPAVVGVLKPRVVTPSDFSQRYTERERQVVLAHEATHIRRHDSRVNAAMALARAVNWFNPLLHLAAHYLRLDQELACDAQVVAAHPAARRTYAQAMLKAQLAARPLPLGCHWLAEPAHPLAQRIAMLSQRTPGPARRLAGAAAVVLLGLAAAGSAWATKPARIEMAPAAVAVPETTPSAPEPERRLRPTNGAARRAAKPAAAPHASPKPERLDRANAPTDPATAPPPAEAAPAASPISSPAPAPRPWRITTNARRSSVEPGKAVRIVAATIDPEGRQLTNDVTAFGSQSLYRTGSYRTNGSRQALFTSVFQRGDHVWVTASLNRRFRAPTAGTVALRSGETGEIVLKDGQVVTVTATIRPETAEEQAQAETALSAYYERVVSRAAQRSRPQTFAALSADPPF